MAACKAPKMVESIDEIPKSRTGNCYLLGFNFSCTIGISDASEIMNNRPHYIVFVKF